MVVNRLYFYTHFTKLRINLCLKLPCQISKMFFAVTNKKDYIEFILFLIMLRSILFFQKNLKYNKKDYYNWVVIKEKTKALY